MGVEKLALLIPIITIILGVAIAMLTIYLHFRRQKELVAFYHQERMAALEKGLDCPPWPEGLLGAQALDNPRRHLLKGLVWLFIGLSAGIAVFAVVDFRRALFGLIPIGIGAAYLIYYFAEGRRQVEAPAPPASALRS